MCRNATLLSYHGELLQLMQQEAGPLGLCFLLLFLQIVCVHALIELVRLHFPWSSVPSCPCDGWSFTYRSECASKCAEFCSDNRLSNNHKLRFALVSLVTCDVVKLTRGPLMMWKPLLIIKS